MRKEQIILSREARPSEHGRCDRCRHGLHRPERPRASCCGQHYGLHRGEICSSPRKKARTGRCHTPYGLQSRRGLSVLTRKNRKMLERQGVTVLTNLHVLSGIERSVFSKVRRHFTRGDHRRSSSPSLLGHGRLKVCVEIAIMAAGCWPQYLFKDVIAVGARAVV